MEFRTSARDKELALGFHKLTATDSAQAAQPLRRLTQATAETVYRTADPYAVAGWDQGSGDDYSDRASDQMRSGAPRYSGQERAAARPTYRTASTYDYGIGAPATPPGSESSSGAGYPGGRGQQPSPYGRFNSDPYRAYQGHPAPAARSGATSPGAGTPRTMPLRRSDPAAPIDSPRSYSTTPHGEGLTPSGQPFPDPAGTTATAASANGAASTVRGGSATTNTGGATTGDGEALVHEDPVTLSRRGTPLDPDGPLHQPSRLPEREGLLLEDLDGPHAGRLPLRTMVTSDGDAPMPPPATARDRLIARAGRRGAVRGASPVFDPADPTAPVAKVGKNAVRGKAAAPGRGALGGQLRRGRLAAAGASRAADTAPAGLSAGTRLVGLRAGSTQGASALAKVTTLLVQQGQRAIAAVVAGLAGTSGATLAMGAAVILSILGVVVSFLPWLQWQHDQESGGPMLAGAIAPGTAGVPAELIPLYNKAGGICPEMPATLLAAQGRQESAFNPRAVSAAGAQGVAQFMPGTWDTYGKDADGDGKANPFDPADAIDAQGRYMCDLAAQVAKLKDQGKVTGDVQTLALAAYNAGLGAVQSSGGVPPYAETQAYAPAILAAAQAFGGTLAPRNDLVVATGDYAGVIATLKARRGTPYSWGGGTVNGPSRGLAQGASTVGWDCSSFMQYGFYQGTGGKVMLPRTAAAQGAALRSTAVPRNALQPGDLLFWGASADSAHHVAMYIGGGQMIEEPRTGLSARITPLQNDFVSAARVPLP